MPSGKPSTMPVRPNHDVRAANKRYAARAAREMDAYVVQDCGHSARLLKFHGRRGPNVFWAPRAHEAFGYRMRIPIESVHPEPANAVHAFVAECRKRIEWHEAQAARLRSLIAQAPSLKVEE